MVHHIGDQVENKQFSMLIMNWFTILVIKQFTINCGGGSGGGEDGCGDVENVGTKGVNEDGDNVGVD